MQTLIYSLRHSLSNAFIGRHERQPRLCPVTHPGQQPRPLIRPLIHPFISPVITCGNTSPDLTGNTVNTPT